jgi:hypothetical protein
MRLSSLVTCAGSFLLMTPRPASAGQEAAMSRARASVASFQGKQKTVGSRKTDIGTALMLHSARGKLRTLAGELAANKEKRTTLGTEKDKAVAALQAEQDAALQKIPGYAQMKEAEQDLHSREAGVSQLAVKLREWREAVREAPNWNALGAAKKMVGELEQALQVESKARDQASATKAQRRGAIDSQMQAVAREYGPKIVAVQHGHYDQLDGLARDNDRIHDQAITTIAEAAKRGGLDSQATFGAMPYQPRPELTALLEKGSQLAKQLEHSPPAAEQPARFWQVLKVISRAKARHTVAKVTHELDLNGHELDSELSRDRTRRATHELIREASEALK